MVELSTKQRATFDRARRYASGLNKEINALRLRADVIAKANSLAPIPGAAEWLTSVQAAILRDQRIQQTISALMVGDLGVRDSVRLPGDLDVIALPGTSADTLNRYYRDDGHLGIPPLVIIIGVVVLVGIVAALVHEHQQASELRNVYKPLKQKADELLCADPTDPKCGQWVSYQQSVEFEAKKSAWERFEEGARSAFGAVKVGLALAVPAIALYLVWSWTKKR